MPSKKMALELLWFDTVVLSNFVRAGGFSWLISRYGKRITITGEVLGEVSAGIAAGYPILNGIIEAVQKKTVTCVHLTVEEIKTFIPLRNRLGAGEASLISAVDSRGGVVVTDDGRARLVCDEIAVKFTGTIGILIAGVRQKTLSIEQADSILDTMRAQGFYSPVSRIKDVL